MKITKTRLTIVCLFMLCLAAGAQNQGESGSQEFDQVSSSIQKKLEQSVEELNQLRERAADEKIPLSRELSSLESKLSEVRTEFQNTTRLLDSRTLDLSNLQNEIKSRKDEQAYLSNLLGEYIRNFETRLHIAELQRYQDPLDTAKLAPENSDLSQQEIYEAQTNLLMVSIDRLQSALGGTRFEGSAVGPDGLVKPGVFLQVGPSVLFQSDDGEYVGTAQQQLGSLEPAVMPFGNPKDASAAAKVIANSAGEFPFDPTQGNAHKIEDTEETLIEHIQKGGPVMFPILGLAGLMLLVAAFKYMSFMFIRTPSQGRVNRLLHDIEKRDQEAAMQKAKKIGGPVGRMLMAGIEHLNEPRELMEEVMYEKILATRLKLERFLPFIAITAASAPLLGLLGTVTGIINTFKLITVFGSGDVKSLSSGISEALITTEFGLIVAIPSLLIHAFLSRKARGVVNQMEKAAVSLANQAAKTTTHPSGPSNISKPVDAKDAKEDVSLEGGLPAMGEAT